MQKFNSREESRAFDKKFQSFRFRISYVLYFLRARRSGSLICSARARFSSFSSISGAFSAHLLETIQTNNDRNERKCGVIFVLYCLYDIKYYVFVFGVRVISPTACSPHTRVAARGVTKRCCCSYAKCTKQPIYNTTLERRTHTHLRRFTQTHIIFDVCDIRAGRLLEHLHAADRHG